MKSIIVCLLITALLLSVSSCKKNELASSIGDASETTTMEGVSNENDTIEDVTDGFSGNNDNEEKDEGENAKKLDFSKNATITDTVMWDEGGLKITANSIDYTNYSAEVLLTIENSGKIDLSVTSNTVGYSCNAVNGVMIPDGYVNCDVPAGKKAVEKASFSYSEMMLRGVTEIADIEIGFTISDDDYNYTYTPPKQIKTSIADSYDYEKNNYQSIIASKEAEKTFKYKAIDFSAEELYDDNGVSLISHAVVEKDNGSKMILLEFINESEEMLNVATRNYSFNGLKVYDGRWSIDTVSPGKRYVYGINLDKIIEEELCGVYGLEEISEVSFEVALSDIDNESIDDGAKVVISIPGTEAAFDKSGEELYNEYGLRVIHKTIAEDPSEYSDNLHILWLIENNGDQEIQVDDVYDSFSINGFMCDCIISSITIKPGEFAVLDVEVYDNDLEDINITSILDVKDVELKFEIEDVNHKEIAEAAIKLEIQK